MTAETPASVTDDGRIELVAPPMLAQRLVRCQPGEVSPDIHTLAEFELLERVAESNRGVRTSAHLVLAPPCVFEGCDPAARESAWLIFYARALRAYDGRFAGVHRTDRADGRAQIAALLAVPPEVLVTPALADAEMAAAPCARFRDALLDLAKGATESECPLRLSEDALAFAGLFQADGNAAPGRVAPCAGDPAPSARRAGSAAPVSNQTIRTPELAADITGIPDEAPRTVCVILVPRALDSAPTLDECSLEQLRLAGLLAARGHRVTVAFDAADTAEPGAAWPEHLRARTPAGVEVVAIQAPEIANTPGQLGRALTRPYNVYDWLKRRHFDVVHAPERGYPAYFALSAKRQGLAFDRTHFCIRAAGPLVWKRLANADPLDNAALLPRIHAERHCLAHADTLVVRSEAMVRWLRAQGYSLPPGRMFLHPPAAGATVDATPNGGTPVDELVFVGVLEPAHGLPQFVHAVARAAAKGGKGFRVTFAGATNPAFPARQFVDAKLTPSGVPWRFREDLDAADVAGYIAAGNRLGIFPYAEANGSSALQSCLEAGVPVLTSRCEGLVEAIRPDDRARVTVELHPDRLAERLRAAVDAGIGPARAKYASSALDDTWRRWHATCVQAAPKPAGRESAEAGGSRSRAPLVTVCVMHFNRPHLVEQAIRSVEAQTHPDIEVVLVDDGSTDPGVPPLLDRLEPTFAARGWRIVRQPNLYLGAARNTAARHARGRFLFFLDDDNVLKPEAVATSVAVADRTGADIVTSFSDSFAGWEHPDDRPPPRPSRIVQIGDDLSFGLFRNGFGDSNALIRTEAFNAVGGNTEDYGIGRDDQEFFARAILQGYRLEHVPEALFWARQPEVRLRHRHYSPHAGAFRVARAYRGALPARLQDLALLAQGQQARSDALQVFGDAERTRRVVTRLRASLSWRLTKPLHRRFNDTINRAGERAQFGASPDDLERFGPDSPAALYRILNSVSWELTAPLRWPGHVAYGFRRAVARMVRRT